MSAAEGTLRIYGGEKITMPDLDLIKQAEQGCGRFGKIKRLEIGESGDQHQAASSWCTVSLYAR